MQPSHDIAILPSSYRRTRRHWSCDGISLMIAGARRTGPSGEPPEARAQLRERLLALLEWMDTRLPTAITTSEHEGVRDVIVFDTFVYRVDRPRREILAGQILDGEMKVCGYAVELLQPLAKSWWLFRIAELHGWTESHPPSDWLACDAPFEDRDIWLADTAYALLKRDPRFSVLRRSLRHALQLDTDVVRLALAAIQPEGARLFNRDLTRVWQHEGDLTQVQRTAPGLLPIAWLVIKEAKVPLSPYPLAAIRRALREWGMPQPAWRQLARRGSRMLRVPMEMARGARLTAIAAFGAVLAEAGVPVPPPPSVLRAYFRLYGPSISFDDWRPLEPMAVLRLAFAEAHKQRRSPKLAVFIDELLSVCEWAAATIPTLNKTERRAGWPLLVKRARVWEQLQCELARRESVAWSCPLTAVAYGDLECVVLADSAAMIAEGFAMRHCVARYVERCRVGRARFFSIRARDGGRRIATLSLHFMQDDLTWVIHDVKGFANHPASAAACRAADELVRQHNRPLLELKLFALMAHFDETTYFAARPHLDVLLSTLAGRPRTDFFERMNDHFGRGITPYAWRYVRDRDVQDPVPH